ncbi:MAG: DUF3000 domain-containing protein [Actinomycetes bacterium]
MAAHEEAPGPTDEFGQALRSLNLGLVRPEVRLESAPAPQRLAPFAAAFTGEVPGPDDRDIATGRLVLLHDPDGVEAWAGRFRLVVYVRADVEPEVASDPLLPGVGWDWLGEALDRHGAAHLALGGTVTRVGSESFGSLAENPPGAELEIRASWTPASADMAPHMAAWCELLCSAAGLPPLPTGVVTIQRRRRS